MVPFKPTELHIDIETYSEIDLKKCGEYKYSSHESFEIQLMTVCWFDNLHRVIETYEPTNGVPIPEHVIKWIKDPDVTKYAFHAKFERVCIGSWLRENLDPVNWRCVMVMSGFAGLPQSLSKVAGILNLTNKKLAGAFLINYFSKPCKPSKANGYRTRNLPSSNPKRWVQYREYNIMDVIVEMDVKEAIINMGVSIPTECWDDYEMDQRLNDRGVFIDTVFALSCKTMAAKIKEKLKADIQYVTGVSNARSTQQLLAWFKSNGVDLPNITKDTIDGYISIADPNTITYKVATMRSQLAKTTTDKYTAALECAEDDSRARGIIAFNGAYRTGRFAGRRVQPQNLSRIHFAKTLNELYDARALARRNHIHTFFEKYDKPIEILGQLIRTVFTASPGKVLIAADYSAIEARVLAWLAEEDWKLEVFNTHGKIYEATAARLFNVPIESITKDSDLRQKGKVAELAFGYGGKLGAVENMGLIKDGTITACEVDPLVDKWRNANKGIVYLWKEYERAAMAAVNCKFETFCAGKCGFYANNNHLFITLPSGRSLAYYRPTIKNNKFGKATLHYKGENDASQWVTLSTWGGKITENICQAVSRDIMVSSQALTENTGYDLVLHVHDENVYEVPKENSDFALGDICKLMSIRPRWAEGLPLRAEGFISEYYRK